MRSLLFTVLCGFALLGACGPADDCGSRLVQYHYGFSYDIAPAFTTPNGIRVDPTGQKVSAALVDRVTDEVERCLTETFGDPPRIPADVVKAGVCRADTFALPLPRSCIVVKVPDDWTLNCDKTQQVLPLLTPGCDPAKHQTPTPECPCRWRAGFQEPNVIVTTPSFFLYKDVLIRTATGCANPWGHPALMKCANPTTDPLYHE